MKNSTKIKNIKEQNRFLESLLKSFEDIKKGRVRTFKFER